MSISPECRPDRDARASFPKRGAASLDRAPRFNQNSRIMGSRMLFSRRKFIGISLTSALSLRASPLLAQGVSTHTAKPLPRPAASGRPFNAHFIDVAGKAGLHAPIVYGGL